MLHLGPPTGVQQSFLSRSFVRICGALRGLRTCRRRRCLGGRRGCRRRTDDRSGGRNRRSGSCSGGGTGGRRRGIRKNHRDGAGAHQGEQGNGGSGHSRTLTPNDAAEAGRCALNITPNVPITIVGDRTGVADATSGSDASRWLEHANGMDEKAIRRAALITLRRAILERQADDHVA